LHDERLNFSHSQPIAAATSKAMNKCWFLLNFGGDEQ